MQALTRAATRAARSAGVRRFATDPVAALEKEVEHAAKETAKWRIVSFACLPVCAGMVVLTMSNAHTHHRHETGYPYMGYKVRDFPWGSDSLFGTK